MRGLFCLFSQPHRGGLFVENPIPMISGRDDDNCFAIKDVPTAFWGR